MPRVKSGTVHVARRKKVIKQAKGYYGAKHRLYKKTKEQVMRSLSFAYRDRKQRKRELRKLWITRINAACRDNNISYSKFINGLRKAEVTVNRKMLAEIAIDSPKSFTHLVEIAKDALDGKTFKDAKVEEPKKEEKTKKEVKEDNKDLSKLTVAELRELAKSKNITGYSTMKKAELIEALN